MATINGSNNNDVLTGTNVNDIIDGGLGADTMEGGLGNDVYYVDNPFDRVIELAEINDNNTPHISRVNITADGNEANDYSDSGASFSADGTKVIFSSFASNLVEGDSVTADETFKSLSDIFIKDLTTGELTRISTNADGNEANSHVFNPSFSADGTKVLFRSNASNLVEGDNNGNLYYDTFVKDLITGEVTLVSVDTDGNQANNTTTDARFSADGTKVIFSSYASNLIEGDNNNVSDIFIKDLITGEVTRVSTDADSNEANDMSGQGSLSADGTKVVFSSVANNLVEGDNNTAPNNSFIKSSADIFIKDLRTGEVTLVSTDAYGNEANNHSTDAKFSADGTKVIFSSIASNLIEGDNNNVGDIFVKDLTTGEVTRVSTDADGNEANGNSSNASLSTDGTKVIFSSVASNLVEGDNNDNSDIFIKDLITGEVTRININTSGDEANDRSYYAHFSTDGTKVIFDSNASNLVDDDTNGVSDIFVVDLGQASGIDTVYSKINYTLTENVENLILTDTATIGWGNELDNSITGNELNNDLNGRDGADNLSGNAGNDNLYGGSGSDTLNGDAGEDRLYGGLDSDTLNGGADIDVLFGGIGDDTLNGDAGADRLYGGIGDDTLNGGSDDDSLDGGVGNDKLNGGLGQDTLSGGFGSDSFVFTAVNHSTNDLSLADVITDFAQGEDKIDLSAIDANSNTTEDDAFTLLNAGESFSGTEGELVFNSYNHSLSGDTDGDSVADFTIIVDNMNAMTLTDFVL